MAAPTLTQVDDWFKQKIVPQRTASGGFSVNRIWKSPRDIFTGNVEDPNGLCGDAALFVCEQFYRDFKGYTTGDGFVIGLILWESSFTKQINHIANVMLLASKKSRQVYSKSQSTGSLVGASAGLRYSGAELANLHTYDLYFKRSASLDLWWKRQSAGQGGTITVGTESDFS